MIGQLRGTVSSIRMPSDKGIELILDVGGVGYRVTAPGRLAASLERGREATLSVHTHVREDALVLYGFGSEAERDMFESLLGAHGVGPSLALTMLGVLSPRALAEAVATGDIDALTAVPGIGKKTAQRLLIELKGPLETVLEASAQASGGAESGDLDQRADLRLALEGLGYRPEEIREVLAQVPRDLDSSDMLRHALKLLAGSR